MPFNVNKFRGDGDLVLLDTLASAATQAGFTVSCVGASGAGAASAANGTYWTFGTDKHEYYVWYNVTGPGLTVSDPVPAGNLIGIPVSISVGAAASSHALAHQTARSLSRISEISLGASAALASAGGSTQFTVSMRAFGDVADARASSTAAGDISSSVFVFVTITASGVNYRNVQTKHVFQASGLIDSLFGFDGSTYDLSGSTYRIADINKGFQGVGSNGTIAANANDATEKSDNLALGDAQRDIAGSNLGGVV